MIALKQILVATDFSEASDAALRYGRQLARTHGATLHLLHVVANVAISDMLTPDSVNSNTGRLQMELEAEARLRLDGLVAEDERTGLATRTMAISAGSIAQTILMYAETEQIDLIIVGTHGRTGFAYFFMGSVAQQVVRLAACPVLTVRHPEREFVVPENLPVAVAVAS